MLTPMLCYVNPNVLSVVDCFGNATPISIRMFMLTFVFSCMSGSEEKAWVCLAEEFCWVEGFFCTGLCSVAKSRKSNSRKEKKKEDRRKNRGKSQRKNKKNSIPSRDALMLHTKTCPKFKLCR